MPVLVPIAELLHETAFFVGESGDALRRDFLEQLIHAAFFGLAALDFALELSGGALLPPPWPPPTISPWPATAKVPNPQSNSFRTGAPESC